MYTRGSDAPATQTTGNSDGGDTDMTTHTQTEPRLTHAGLIESAKGLAERARARAEVADDLRHLPHETVGELIGARLPQVLVPKEHGGSEMSLETLYEVTAQIAAGDAATGWCAGLMMHEPHFVGMFPAEAQEDVWQNGPNVVVGSSVLPATQVETLADGYRLTGAAPFSTGSQYAEWVIIGGMVQLDDGADWRLFLVPRNDYTVKDVWHMTGMRGTASNVVLTEGAFVPRTHTLRQRDVVEGTAPGGLVNANPMYRLPWVAVSPYCFTGTLVGSARGAWSYFVEWTRSRSTAGGSGVSQFAHVQETTGRTSGMIHAADLLNRSCLARVQAGAVSLEDRAAIMRDVTLSARFLLEAIDELIESAGTAGFSKASPLERFWRDMHLAAAHIALNPHSNFGHHGRLTLGLERSAQQPFY